MTRVLLKVPATSANLGPGFDALGLAMQMYLEVEAEPAPSFRIVASGRNAEVIEQLEENLMVETYRSLAPKGPPLQLLVRNEIPLGMGCGSSAAALTAGVLLANHFGKLQMGFKEMVAEACWREGHPDNVAACFFGGLTVSAMREGRVTAASFGEGLNWRLLLALPRVGLATSRARALLPESYSRADAVANVQATALLVAAFALGRPNLLLEGTRDRMHQPYRSEACPLLPKLLPLAGTEGIWSVALSGAGPSVLLLADPEADLRDLVERVRAASGDGGLEVVETRISSGVSLITKQ